MPETKRVKRLAPYHRNELDFYFATHESTFGLTSTFGAFVGLAQTGVMVSGGGKDPEARITDRKFGGAPRDARDPEAFAQDGDVARVRRVYVRLAPLASHNTATFQALALHHGPYDWHGHYTRIEPGTWDKLDKALCANGPAYQNRVGVLFLSATLQARHAARVASLASKAPKPKAEPEKLAKGKRKPKATQGSTIADTLLALVRADDHETLRAIRREGEALLLAAWAAYAEQCPAGRTLVDADEDARPVRQRVARLSRSRRAASVTGRVSSAEVDAWA